MNRPHFSPSSLNDLRETLKHISKDKPGAAFRHVERLENACWSLAKNPGMGTVRDDLLPNLRCWSVGSYVIFYRPANDGIDVVRVLHGARDHGALLTEP